MVAADTSPQMRGHVVSVFSAMSGPERIQCATEMADEVREVALAGVRSRNHGMGERDAAIEWLRILHGDAVAEHARRCSSSS